jgi:4-diphosphocytidyl-2-C-methyl-D-erythritol kinase
MKEININAHGKVNLSIDVLCKRPDGYHEVEMILQQIDMFDEIRVRYCEKDIDGLIQVSSDIKDLPQGEENIAWKAAKLMQDRFPEKALGNIYIRIRKRIPMAAGLGGGSADAAAVLHGLNVLWEKKLSISDLMKIGVNLGADVPFCIMAQGAKHGFLGFDSEGLSTCALAKGIGEKLSPVKPLKAYVVLAKPPISVSTKEIYQSLDVNNIKTRPDTESLIHGLISEDFSKVVEEMHNVLEEVSVKKYPIINDEINKLRSLSPEGSKVIMSGSGPTAFTLVKSKGEAESIYKALKEKGSMVFLTKTSF